jgi:hypothetical protein
MVCSKRFSIRTALIAILVVCVACRFAPTLYRRIKFSEQYEALNVLNQEQWTRTPGHIDGYEFQAPNGALLSVWTSEHEYVNETGLTEPKSYAPDPTRFFVMPPGKWVNAVDEVLQVWDHYD